MPASEPPGLIRVPSLSFLGRSESSSRHTVINVDDDDDDDLGLLPRRGSGRRARSTVDDNTRPANRRRTSRANSVVVIDDTIDIDQGPSPSRNGAQNRPIVVLDSDEEQPGPSSRFRTRGFPRRRGGTSSSSFRIFSPSPPRQQPQRMPPVPPPVIAGPLPFAVLPPAPNPNRNRNRLPFDEPPQPASRERNGNGGSRIHLGGGLLSQAGRGRAQIYFQPPRADDFDELFDEGPPDPQPNPFSLDAIARLGRFVRSYVGGGQGSGPASSSSGRRNARIPPRHFQRHIEQLMEAQAQGVGPGAGFFGLAVGGGAWARRDAALGLGPDYEKSMTHPGRPGPGWTFDFGAEHDEEEEGDAKEGDMGAEILVCARCMDPLIANADGMVDVGEEERKEHRVWGLRCGHVLDGKCVGALMRPGTVSDIEAKSMGKGKGKGKAEEVEGKDKVSEKATQKGSEVGDAEEKEVDEPVEDRDVKGKGKEKMPITPPHSDRAPTPPLLTDTNRALESADLPPDLDPENNSIRSRLRSRHTIESSSTALPVSLSPRRARVPPRGMPVPLTGSPAATTRRRGAKRKRDEEQVDPVEDRWEWICPVAGCGRQHTSVKVGGVWKMDENFGAVAMFV